MKKEITFDSCLENIKKILLYIIERNQDIDIPDDEHMTEEFAIYLDELNKDFYSKFGSSYIISIGEYGHAIRFFIAATTNVENAKYVLNNIDRIFYIQDQNNKWDSCVGYIEDFYRKFRKMMKMKEKGEIKL